MNELRIRRNPIALFYSSDPWRATAYLLTYIPVGSILFGVTLALLIVTLTLSIFWIGLPLLVVAAVVIRGCAEVERGRARIVGAALLPNYRVPPDSGLLSQIKTRWTDPSTLRNVAYLLALFPILLTLNIAGLAIWIACLGMITVPAWYWSIPGGVQILGPALGGLSIDTLPAALAAALLFAVLALPASYVVVGAAKLHASIARVLLGLYVDPLAEAKRVLTTEGPLSAQRILARR